MPRRKKDVEALDLAEPLRVQGELIPARQLVLPGRVTKTSLELPANLLFEEWARIGKKLHEVSECTMWWIGDWLLYGPGAFGKMYEDPVRATGFKAKTLAQAKMVAKRFPDFSVRTEKLSWEHHLRVASIEDDALVKRLLDLAATGKNGKRWSVATLRAIVGCIREGATLEEALDVVLAIPDEESDVDLPPVSEGAYEAVAAARLGGTLHDFRNNLMIYEPEEVAAQIDAVSRPRFYGEVAQMHDWLQRVMTALEEAHAKAA